VTTDPDVDVAAVRLRTVAGGVLDLPVERWLQRASAAEYGALDRALSPALDIGCGPGRHVVALAERGVFALGIDISPGMLAVARQRRANVLEKSVFDRVPGTRRWRTALLLDGNIGIGGEPVALLHRVMTLLASDGRVLVEHEADDSPPGVMLVRAETALTAGPWFRWTTVGPRRLEVLARSVGLAVIDTWNTDGRHFAQLERDGSSRS
jgi:SAM-dependent methyltransferase